MRNASHALDETAPASGSGALHTLRAAPRPRAAGCRVEAKPGRSSPWVLQGRKRELLPRLPGSRRLPPAIDGNGLSRFNRRRSLFPHLHGPSCWPNLILASAVLGQARQHHKTKYRGKPAGGVVKISGSGDNHDDAPGHVDRGGLGDANHSWAQMLGQVRTGTTREGVSCSKRKVNQHA